MVCLNEPFYILFFLALLVIWIRIVSDGSFNILVYVSKHSLRHFVRGLKIYLIKRKMNLVHYQNIIRL